MSFMKAQQEFSAKKTSISNNPVTQQKFLGTCKNCREICGFFPGFLLGFLTKNL